MPTLETTKSGYKALWEKAQISPDKVSAARTIARKIIANRDKYEEISRKTGVPIAMIGALHMRESAMRFDRHLHCGDPLTARTVHVPKGRPKTGEPPFSFEESAVDALAMPPHSLSSVKNWTVQRILFETERYNGWGYLGKGNSPYVWSWTNNYKSGKYVADHVYDPNAIDKQPGCVAIYKALVEADSETAAVFKNFEDGMPDDVRDKINKDKSTEKTKNAKRGGGVVAGGGVVNEGTKTGTTQPDKAPSVPLVPSWLAYGAIGLGIAIVVIAVVLERKRLKALLDRWGT